MRIGFFGWRVTAACFWLATVAWGVAFYGHGVYLAQLQLKHGWSAALVGGATTFSYLAGAAMLPFVSAAFERFGARPVLLAGLAAYVAGAAGIASAAEPWQLFPVYFAVSVGWATTSLAAINIVLAPWFVAKRGLAISLALTGASFGGILAVPLMLACIARLGFEAGLPAAVGLLALSAVPVVLAFVRSRPEELGLAPDGAPRPADIAPVGPAAPAAASPARSRGAVLRDPGFWAIAAPFALALMAQVGFLVHQIAYLTPALGEAGVALAVALTTAAAVAGRLGLGLLIDRLERRTAAAATFLCQAAAVGATILSKDPAVLYAACVVFGLSVGNLITLPSLFVQRAFPPAAFGPVVGLVTAVCQIAYSFGPGLLGAVRDLAGTYDAAAATVMALEIAAAAIVLVAGRRRAGPTGA